MIFFHGANSDTTAETFHLPVVGTSVFGGTGHGLDPKTQRTLHATFGVGRQGRDKDDDGQLREAVFLEVLYHWLSRSLEPSIVTSRCEEGTFEGQEQLIIMRVLNGYWSRHVPTCPD